MTGASELQLVINKGRIIAVAILNRKCFLICVIGIVFYIYSSIWVNSITLDCKIVKKFLV